MRACRFRRAIEVLKFWLSENRPTVGMIALALLAAALFLPALETQNDLRFPGEWAAGFNFAAIGFLGPLEGEFGWYANPILVFLIARLLKNRITHWLLGALAVFLIVSTRLFFGEGCADSCEDVVGFGPGYYLWLVSAVLLTLVALADRFKCADTRLK
jgi:hypothetical protein